MHANRRSCCFRLYHIVASKGAPMKFFSKLTLIASAVAPLLAQDSQQGQTPQRELGVVRGTVRAETGETITSAELTLSAEPPPSLVDSFKSIASSMGVPPGEVQSVL